jgi:hypothetical protein
VAALVAAAVVGVDVRGWITFGSVAALMLALVGRRYWERRAWLGLVWDERVRVKLDAGVGTGRALSETVSRSLRFWSDMAGPSTDERARAQNRIRYHLARTVLTFTRAPLWAPDGNGGSRPAAGLAHPTGDVEVVVQPTEEATLSLVAHEYSHVALDALGVPQEQHHALMEQHTGWRP